MKKFLSNTAKFLMFLAIFFTLNILVSLCIHKYSNHSLKSSSIIILGDSHAEKAIDPKHFINAQNISKSGEPYVLSYWKLKYLSERIKFDSIILGYSYHNLSGSNDLKFSNKKWAEEMFKRSIFINDFKAIDDLVTIDYISYYKVKLKNIALFPYFNRSNLIGKYTNSSKSDLRDPFSRIQSHFYYKGKALDESIVSINYLDSIVELCQKNKTELVLLGTPLHSKYLDSIPESFIQLYQSNKDKMIKKGISVFDFTSDNYADSLFLDINHLNEKGANHLTAKLKNALNQ